jgi:uridine phosphorylase
VTLRHEIRAIHLKPAADLADRVLLPGDPHRALAVAQHLLEGPKMFNHSRGLWGYTGVAGDGELLTVQATGIGGPSAAIVVEELIALGARRLVRIGTCGALVDGLELGDLVAADSVLPADGASAALGADGDLRADPELLERLVAAGARPATVVSSDLFYDPRDGEAGVWTARGAAVVEMEAAAILQVAARRGVAAACVLGVSDVPSAEGSRRADAEHLERIGLRVGEAGYAAVSKEPGAAGRAGRLGSKEPGAAGRAGRFGTTTR